MKQQISVAALVATTPRHLVKQDGQPITSFRVAANTGDAETNWYTLTCYGQLAVNVAASVHKGERILIVGTLRIRDWDNGERAGTSAEIEADSIGHDLCWGTSTYARNVEVRSMVSAD